MLMDYLSANPKKLELIDILKEGTCYCLSVLHSFKKVSLIYSIVKQERKLCGGIKIFALL